MNPDVTYASCDAPQEKTDKEVELDEDGNEVRMRDCFFFRFDVDGVVLFLSSPSTPLKRVLSRRVEGAGAGGIVATPCEKKKRNKWKKMRFFVEMQLTFLSPLFLSLPPATKLYKKKQAEPEEEEEDYAPSLPLHEETWDGPFEPAAHFAGAKKGFVFKNGPLGVGYYGDDGGKSSKKAASSKAGGAGGGGPSSSPPKRRPAVWQLVTENVYIHRHAKQLHEDDIMLCACAPLPPNSVPAAASSSSGGVVGGGCGEACINRTLNLECVAGHCPSCTRDDEDCGNQRFARKQGAPLESKRAGAKGFGLFSKVDLVKGQFIIEYVGEVLEEEEYARRKNFYAEVGQVSSKAFFSFLFRGQGGGVGGREREAERERRKSLGKKNKKNSLFILAFLSPPKKLNFSAPLLLHAPRERRGHRRLQEGERDSNKRENCV